MLIHRVAAEFNDGSRRSLEFRDGLNLVETPPSGQTDWLSVLTLMLFGPSGPEPDSVRGTSDVAFLRGELIGEASGRALTIARDLSDPSAPTFQALDADGAAIEDLTAENCGERLTGVPRDVFAQIARLEFPELRDAQADGAETAAQSGDVAQSGETDTQASDADTVTRSERIRNLKARLEREQARLKELEQQEMSLNRELRGMDNGGQASEEGLSQSDGVPNFAALSAAYAAMKRKLDEDHIPELDEIARLRGAIVNIMTAGRQLDKAEAEREQAERALSDAKADVNSMPFDGMSPEEAEHSPLKLPFKPYIPKWLAIAFLLAVLTGMVFLLRFPSVTAFCLWLAFLAVGIGAGWGVRKWNERWELIAAERRRERKADLIQYAKFYRAMEDAQAEADMKISAADTLRESLSTNERGILREIHRFAPEASTMPEADAQLRLCAKRRKELSIAEAVVKKAEEAERTVPGISVISQPDGHHVILTDLSPQEASKNPDAAPLERDKLVQALNEVREERTTLRLEIRRDKEELSETESPDAAQEFGAENPGGAEGSDGNGRTPDAPSWERVLTESPAAPIVLSDAFREFDDDALSDALRVLERIAQEKQAILFTSDNRWAELCENRPEIFIQRLTE